MPTPAFYEARALELWPYRWAFGAGSVGMFLLMLGFVSVYAKLGLESSLSARAFFALFAVLSGAAVWFWGLLLIAAWFHPIHGWMRVDRPGILPRVVQLVLRWHASLMLGLLFLFPLLILYLYACLA